MRSMKIANSGSGARSRSAPATSTWPSAPTSNPWCACWTPIRWRRQARSSTCPGPEAARTPPTSPSARMAGISRRPCDAPPRVKKSRRSGDPAFVLVWDLRSPDRPPAVVRTFAVSQGLALSPDGRTVYTAFPLSAYDVRTGRKVWSTNFLSFLVLDISPDGRLLASEVQEQGRSHPADRCTHRKDPADLGRSQAGCPRPALLGGRQPTGLGLPRRPAHRVGRVHRRATRWSRTSSRWGGALTSARTGTGYTRVATTPRCVPGTCTGTSSSCAGCSRGKAARSSSTSRLRPTARGWPTCRPTSQATRSPSSIP